MSKYVRCWRCGMIHVYGWAHRCSKTQTRTNMQGSKQPKDNRARPVELTRNTNSANSARG